MTALDNLYRENHDTASRAIRRIRRAFRDDPDARVDVQIWYDANEDNPIELEFLDPDMLDPVQTIQLMAETFNHFCVTMRLHLTIATGAFEITMGEFIPTRS